MESANKIPPSHLVHYDLPYSVQTESTHHLSKQRSARQWSQKPYSILASVTRQSLHVKQYISTSSLSESTKADTPDYSVVPSLQVSQDSVRFLRNIWGRCKNRTLESSLRKFKTGGNLIPTYFEHQLEETSRTSRRIMWSVHTMVYVLEIKWLDTRATAGLGHTTVQIGQYQLTKLGYNLKIGDSENDSLRIWGPCCQISCIIQKRPQSALWRCWQPEHHQPHFGGKKHKQAKNILWSSLMFIFSPLRRPWHSVQKSSVSRWGKEDLINRFAPPLAHWTSYLYFSLLFIQWSSLVFREHAGSRVPTCLSQSKRLQREVSLRDMQNPDKHSPPKTFVILQFQVSSTSNWHRMQTFSRFEKTSRKNSFACKGNEKCTLSIWAQTYIGKILVCGTRQSEQWLPYAAYKGSRSTPIRCQASPDQQSFPLESPRWIPVDSWAACRDSAPSPPTSWLWRWHVSWIFAAASASKKQSLSLHHQTSALRTQQVFIHIPRNPRIFPKVCFEPLVLSDSESFK